MNARISRPCKKCGTEFSIWNCPVCAKKRTDAWMLENRGRKLASNKAWAKSNPESLRVASAKWKSKNPEKVLANSAAWKKANPDLHRIHEHNRRAQKKSAGGSLTKGLAERLYALQKGKCPCCKQPLGDDYHLDHIKPLALGGSNTDDNMQLLRATCNLQKHAKHPVDFMQSRGFLL